MTRETYRPFIIRIYISPSDSTCIEWRLLQLQPVQGLMEVAANGTDWVAHFANHNTDVSVELPDGRWDVRMLLGPLETGHTLIEQNSNNVTGRIYLTF